ncbi:hypothetical protein [uncultured Microbacterium sp.]|uniref:hypothetical protein n=1 Tax=uncultured Microbacterium sp. TaxID=191216 RepID=UPI0028D7C859|nr:hypothetical protein [uncultured Microbacterium sp.]
MAPASAWHVAQRQELSEEPEELHVFERKGRRHTVAKTASALWLISEWGDGARIACRLALTPGYLRVDAIAPAPDGSSVEVAMSSSLGDQTASVAFEKDGTISATTTLRAAEDMVFEGWPRDIVPDLDDRTEGRVHTHQRGLRTGLLHASLTGPASGSFMYLQDLTLLGDYCDASRASAADTVGGDWPDIGFALPLGEAPIDKGASITISAWRLALADEVPEQPVAVADQYLTLLAALYFHIDRPTPDYIDWLERADASRAALESSEACWLEVEGGRYLRAYVGDDNHPPESMVQLAVLVPLLERSMWSSEEDPLIESLGEILGTFHDDRTGMIGRWLPGAEQLLDGGEEHEGPRIMDSWYLFHPLLNLGRLAKHGDERARRMLLGSLDRVIEIAHHFRHEWPIFYDIDTLEVIKAEAEPGKGGEKDVPGIYAHVMLQAHELTGEQRYLDEAREAAGALRGKGFELAYQTNTVAFGMVALQRLSALTGEPEWRDLSRVLCACLLDNVGLWSIRYGWRKARSTFCAVFPMPDAPYTAAYEEAEVAGAVVTYLVEAGDAIAPSLEVLLPELIRHVTAKLDDYYPQHIPQDALSQEPKTGHTEPDIWIPVEDVGDGFEEAGTVGQEVYGAGIAFSTMARTHVRLEKSGIQLSCEYPFEVTASSAREVRLRIFGDRRLKARVRLVMPASDGFLARWSDHWVSAGRESTISLTDVQKPAHAAA